MRKQKVKFKNPVLNWIEFRLPIVSYFKKEYGDYPMPKNCNSFRSFGALATTHQQQTTTTLPQIKYVMWFAAEYARCCMVEQSTAAHRVRGPPEAPPPQCFVPPRGTSGTRSGRRFTSSALVP